VEEPADVREGGRRSSERDIPDAAKGHGDVRSIRAFVRSRDMAGVVTSTRAPGDRTQRARSWKAPSIVHVVRPLRDGMRAPSSRSTTTFPSAIEPRDDERSRPSPPGTPSPTMNAPSRAHEMGRYRRTDAATVTKGQPSRRDGGSPGRPRQRGGFGTTITRATSSPPSGSGGSVPTRVAWSVRGPGVRRCRARARRGVRGTRRVVHR
jgi:hypothetical protein